MQSPRFPKHMDMRPQPPSHPPHRRRTRSVSTAPIINEDDVVVHHYTSGQSPGRELAEAMFKKWRSVAAEQGQMRKLIDNLVIHHDTSRRPMPTVELYSYTSGMPAPRVEPYSFLIVQRM